MKKILLFLLLLGLVSAEITCSGDNTPNLATNLILNCTTEPSISRCEVITSYNNTIIQKYPEYPDYFLLEDRTPYITEPDGRFYPQIFINDKIYSQGIEYTATIICVNTNDNTSSTTTFQFTPSSYAPANWFGSMIDYLRSNAGYFFIGLVILLLILIFIAYIVKSTIL